MFYGKNELNVNLGVGIRHIAWGDKYSTATQLSRLLAICLCYKYVTATQ